MKTAPPNFKPSGTVLYTYRCPEHIGFDLQVVAHIAQSRAVIARKAKTAKQSLGAFIWDEMAALVAMAKLE